MQLTKAEAEAKAYELIRRHGRTGISALENTEPEMREIGTAIGRYIAENFRVTANERCWPGALSHDGHPQRIIEYLLATA